MYTFEAYASGFNMSRIDHCGNCSHDCCCRCERGNGDCWYCNDDTHTVSNYGRCAWGNLPKKYICLDCKHVWKGMWGNSEFHIKMIDGWGKQNKKDAFIRKKGEKKGLSEEEIQELLGGYPNTGSPACNRCSKAGLPVSTTLRPPKQSDKEGWEVLTAVIEELGTFPSTLHMTDEERKHNWIPTKKHELERWRRERKKPYKTLVPAYTKAQREQRETLPYYKKRIPVKDYNRKGLDVYH